MSLTRDDVVAVLGPVDDSTIAEIVATGASRSELAEAAIFEARHEKATISCEVANGEQ